MSLGTTASKETHDAVQQCKSLDVVVHVNVLQVVVGFVSLLVCFKKNLHFQSMLEFYL